MALDAASFVHKECEEHFAFFADQAKKSPTGVVLTFFKIGIPDHDGANDRVLDFCIGLCNRHSINVKRDIFYRGTAFFQRDESSCAAGLKFRREVLGNDNTERTRGHNTEEREAAQ